jgi:hypothetical protein
VAAHAHHTVTEEEMAALHFGVYYRLLMNKPTVMPLPQLWNKATSQARTGVTGSAICPPAVFQRD